MAKKILIAEDDTVIKNIMEIQLKNDFEVDVALNGAEALKKIHKNKYDIILLDLIMPIKDGFDVLAQLKKEKNKVPVLVFSNLSQDGEKSRAFKLGAKGYFVKADLQINEITQIAMNHLNK